MKTKSLTRRIIALFFLATMALSLATAGLDPDRAAVKAEKMESRSRRVLERAEIRREAAETTPSPTPTPIRAVMTKHSGSKRKAQTDKADSTPTPTPKQVRKIPRQLNRLQ